MRAIAIVVAVLLPGVAVFAEAPASTPAYRVIVHPGNPTATVDRGFLADVFLKKITRWRDGESIRPVDLVDSSVRRAFAEDVLKRSVAAVRSYWQQLIFSGRGVPPPELDSDAAVIAFVLKNPGAVGYVSGGADVGRAKLLSVR